MDLLKSLLSSQCWEQLGSFLSERKFLNCFYSMLGIQDFSNIVKAAVCEVRGIANISAVDSHRLRG